MQLAPSLRLRNLSQDRHLIRHVPQDSEDFSVAFNKAKGMISQPFVGVLGCKVLHEHVDLTEVVSRHAREEVVRDLHVQTAVEKVEVRWAADVHRCAQLAMRKAFGRA